MDKLPIEIAIGQTNILIEDEVCKAVRKVGIHINKEELLKALKAYEFVEELTNYIFEYPDDDYMTMECLCRKLVKHGLLDKVDGYYQTHEIRTNTHECVKDTHDKTENSSEKPNNCEDCKWWFGYCHLEECEYEPKDEPTSSKMEQVDKDINVRSKWETPPKFDHKGIQTACVTVPAWAVEIEDESQISPSDCKTCKNNLWSTPRTCGKCSRQEDGKPSMYESKDEPQTCSFSDCDNFKNPDYERCIECKRKQIKLKTEQTERSSE